jgi:hypothetical protein
MFCVINPLFTNLTLPYGSGEITVDVVRIERTFITGIVVASGMQIEFDRHCYDHILYNSFVRGGAN